MACRANVEDKDRLAGSGIGDPVDATARHGRAIARSHDPVFAPRPVPDRAAEDLDPFVLTQMQMARHETARLETNLGSE